MSAVRRQSWVEPESTDLDTMHARLDEIRDERPTGNDIFERIISTPHVAGPLMFLAAVLIGYGLFNGRN